MTGTVKWFNPDKGWGFIKQSSGHDVFAYYSEIEVVGNTQRMLIEGEAVEFDVKESPKGLVAVNIRRLPGG